MRGEGLVDLAVEFARGVVGDVEQRLRLSGLGRGEARQGQRSRAEADPPADQRGGLDLRPGRGGRRDGAALDFAATGVDDDAAIGQLPHLGTLGQEGPGCGDGAVGHEVLLVASGHDSLWVAMRKISTGSVVYCKRLITPRLVVIFRSRRATSISGITSCNKRKIRIKPRGLRRRRPAQRRPGRWSDRRGSVIR